MLVRTNLHYTPALLRANPEFIFVFGDNLQRWGKGGQAIIRDEPNTCGLATKASPAEFFTDDCFGVIEHEIEVIFGLAQTNMVVIPFTDKVELGTGLSELPTRAPALYELLSLHFTKDMPRAALKVPQENPVTMVCRTCGSEDVVRDAWADWDVDAQDWVLSQTFDYAFCNSCEGDTRIEERLL